MSLLTDVYFDSVNYQNITFSIMEKNVVGKLDKFFSQYKILSYKKNDIVLWAQDIPQVTVRKNNLCPF